MQIPRSRLKQRCREEGISLHVAASPPMLHLSLHLPIPFSSHCFSTSASHMGVFHQISPVPGLIGRLSAKRCSFIAFRFSCYAPSRSIAAYLVSGVSHVILSIPGVSQPEEVLIPLIARARALKLCTSFLCKRCTSLLLFIAAVVISS